MVRIDFSEPLKTVPAGFAVQSPARITLDFPGVRNGMGRTNVGINQGNVKGVNVVQANDRTRVVLNLKRATPYKSAIDGNSLLVSLAPASEAASPEKRKSTVFSESRNASVAPLKNIDFRRSVENAGRVIIDLDSNQVGVDIRQQGDKLVVEFLKTSLPEQLRSEERRVGKECRSRWSPYH